MHRLCYIGVDSSNERSQKRKKKLKKYLFPIILATIRENFTANSAKTEKRDPTYQRLGYGLDF
jgi:hypothetical protein